VRKLLLAGPLLLVLAGCGGGRSSTPVTVTATTTSPPPTAATAPATTQTAERRTTMRVYFLRGEKVGPAAREVTGTRAVGRAALEQLLAGPTAAERGDGLTSALADGTNLLGLSIAAGVATVRLSPEPDSRQAQAQVVYTLTQFPTVRSVRLGSGAPLARSTFEGETPQILVESPLPGAEVASPIRISGTANTFEATFQADVVDGAGKVLSTTTVTATSGSGDRGTFAEEIPFESGGGPGKLVVYELSAESGARTHEVEIPLRLAP